MGLGGMSRNKCCLRALNSQEEQSTPKSKHLLHIEGPQGFVVGNRLRLEVLHRAQPDREVKDMSTGDHIRAQIGKVRVFLGEDLTDKLLKGLPGYLLLEKG